MVCSQWENGTDHAGISVAEEGGEGQSLEDEGWRNTPQLGTGRG